jgi:hypothetical protein
MVNPPPVTGVKVIVAVPDMLAEPEHPPAPKSSMLALREPMNVVAETTSVT